MVLKSEYNKRMLIRGLDVIYGGKLKVCLPLVFTFYLMTLPPTQSCSVK